LPRNILRSALIAAVSASLLLHALAGVVMWIAAPAPVTEAADEPILVDFDVNEAPPPPEAEMPAEEEATPPPEPAPPEPAAEEIAVPEPEPVAPPEPPEPIAALDAAPPAPDAAVPVDAGVDDATVDDAAVDATVDDAGADADAALLAAHADDAGAQAAVAAAADAGVHDAGLLARAGSDADAGANAAAAAGIDAGAGGAVASTDEAGDDRTRMGAGLAMPSTSDINLLAYLPPGDVVSVLVRFDRLRGWPWAAQAEAILAPMPDYRTLIGKREVAVSDLFDFIVISTPAPRDVTATTIVGRARLAGPDVRALINHPDAPVAWYAARGGVAGRRLPSALVQPGDPRMFLLPRPGWVVLAQPRYLGVLPQPAEGAIDTAVASEADLPDWLARVPAIEEATGNATTRGPVLMVTVQGLLPPRWRAPFLGEIETPRRLTLAVEVARGGFYVRGAMLFDSEAQAERFIAAFGKAQAEATTAPLGKALLARFHLYHALNGLSFKRNGTKVSYATSISVADARGLLDRTAAQLRSFFGTGGPQPRQPRPEPEPTRGRPQPPRPEPPQPTPEPAPAQQQPPTPQPAPQQPPPTPPTPTPAPPQQPPPTPTPTPTPPAAPP
jgi:outer membrane biosynthesis protein TonB